MMPSTFGFRKPGDSSSGRQGDMSAAYNSTKVTPYYLTQASRYQTETSSSRYKASQETTAPNKHLEANRTSTFGAPSTTAGGNSTAPKRPDEAGVSQSTRSSSGRHTYMSSRSWNRSGRPPTPKPQDIPLVQHHQTSRGELPLNKNGCASILENDKCETRRPSAQRTPFAEPVNTRFGERVIMYMGSRAPDSGIFTSERIGGTHGFSDGKVERSDSSSSNSLMSKMLDQGNHEWSDPATTGAQQDLSGSDRRRVSPASSQVSDSSGMRRSSSEEQPAVKSTSPKALLELLVRAADHCSKCDRVLFNDLMQTAGELKKLTDAGRSVIASPEQHIVGSEDEGYILAEQIQDRCARLGLSASDLIMLMLKPHEHTAAEPRAQAIAHTSVSTAEASSGPQTLLNRSGDWSDQLPLSSPSENSSIAVGALSANQQLNAHSHRHDSLVRPQSNGDGKPSYFYHNNYHAARDKIFSKGHNRYIGASQVCYANSRFDYANPAPIQSSWDNLESAVGPQTSYIGQVAQLTGSTGCLQLPNEPDLLPVNETRDQRFFEARGPKPLLQLLTVLENTHYLTPEMLTALLVHFLPTISQRTQKKTGRMNSVSVSALRAHFFADRDCTRVTVAGALVQQTATTIQRYPLLAQHAEKLRLLLADSDNMPCSIRPGTIVVDALKSFMKVPFRGQVEIISELAVFLMPMWRWCLNWCWASGEGVHSLAGIEVVSIQDVTHWDFECGNCHGRHIIGPRFHCETCALMHKIEFNLCGPCFLTKYESDFANHAVKCYFRDVSAIVSSVKNPDHTQVELTPFIDVTYPPPGNNTAPRGFQHPGGVLPNFTTPELIKDTSGGTKRR